VWGTERGKVGRPRGRVFSGEVAEEAVGTPEKNFQNQTPARIMMAYVHSIRQICVRGSTTAAQWNQWQPHNPLGWRLGRFQSLIH